MFPRTLEEALEAKGEVRAGGTDLQERRRHRISVGPIVDLRDVPGLQDVEPTPTGGLRIGARATLSALAEHPQLREGYPGLAEAAGALATPQIRAVATLGGNLLQRTRCWYYRNPDAHCLKKGGSQCLARAGDHLFHACFDRGPCVSVHPSTLGMALLAYDAGIEVAGGEDRSVEALFGNGSDPRVEHRLESGALLRAVVLPTPVPKEQSAYVRATSRARAEWPLVEVLARLVLDQDEIVQAAISIGGVAPVPLRLPEVEAALMGGSATSARLEAAAALASKGASPLPMTAYKVDLLPGTVLETLERAMSKTPVSAGAAGKAGKLPKRSAPGDRP